MRDGTEKEKEQRKISFILYGILYVLFIIFIAGMANAERTNGRGYFSDGIQALTHFNIVNVFNPYNAWEVIKWSAFYWICIGLWLIYEQRFHHDMAGRESGSAHWNKTVEEFNQEHNEPFGEKTFSDEPELTEKMGGENLNNKKTPPVPGNPNMIESAAVRLSTADMKTHLNNNVFIVGGAGTGKSRFFIKPNVLQMNCSYVVTDPSGELLKSMHNVLADNGYKIKVFNLVDMRYSNKYNPFKYVRSDTDVSILVDCFISNTTGPDQKSGDPFWDKSEKALLSALIFYLVDIADEDLRKFSTILWMVQLAQMDEDARMSRDEAAAKEAQKHFSFSLDNPLDELFNGTKKITKKMVKDKYGKMQEVLVASDISDPKEVGRTQEKIETSLCLTNYKTFKLGGTKTLKSILISAAVRLNPFSMPAIQNLTDEDNVELEKVGDELTCFFAIIPQTNSTFNFLISMLFSQMFEALYYKGSTIPNSRLNYHVRFLLDEFANIGKIPEFPQKISTCRKYNISTTIVLQSIAQIKMLYKDDYETIIGNCDTAICLGTNEQTTADYFSKKLGVGTITAKGRSLQVGKSGGSMSFNQTKRELMTPDEIMTMPFNECIVMMRGIDPFHDLKYPLETHPQFMKTGDGDKDNFYFLENDASFLCVDDSKILAQEMMEEELESNEDNDEADKYKPKNLAEVLGDILVNVPEEDGYYLIRDADKEDSKKLFASVLHKARKDIEKSLEDKEKTASVLFDGEYMDMSLLKPLTNRLMSEYITRTDDIAVSCFGMNEDLRKVYAAAVNDECNIIKAFERLSFDKEIVSENEKFKTYEITTPLTNAKFDRFQEACEKGYQVIVSNPYGEDDPFAGYD